MADFVGGIQHCATVVGKWTFDRNITFLLPLNCDSLTTVALMIIRQKGNINYK